LGKRLPYETIDVYFNHFHKLLEELGDVDIPISTKSTICHFIFVLFDLSLKQFKTSVGLVISHHNGILKIGQLF
jgi:hypothetical protein